MSQYFDIRLIDDYLELGLDFKVYVNGEYLIVNDPRDLVNKKVGKGYDSDGKPVHFKFIDIDHVRVGSNVLTVQGLLDLQKPSEPEQSPEGEEGMEEQPPEGEEGMEGEEGEEQTEPPPIPPEKPEPKEKKKPTEPKKEPAKQPK